MLTLKILRRYCSVEHQKAHRAAHKFQCNLVKKSLARLADEEAKLRARTTEDASCPANPFENAVGQFWLFTPTRPYMQARFDVVTDQIAIRTGEAVESALGHMLGMLRLNRTDNKGVRSQIPAQYLRLGKDQEAFDFLKWMEERYEDGNPDAPFLDVKDADAMQPIDLKASSIGTNLSFKVALLLLKARLFVDVSMLEGFLQNLGTRAPPDRMEIVKEECMSGIMLTRRDIIDAANFLPIMANLRQQMVAIYRDIKKHNKYMTRALENPSLYANSQLEAWSFGSEREAIMAFRYSWYSWAECGTVLQNILPLLKEECP